jgi:hypothetical protein
MCAQTSWTNMTACASAVERRRVLVRVGSCIYEGRDRERGKVLRRDEIFGTGYMLVSPLSVN